MIFHKTEHRHDELIEKPRLVFKAKFNSYYFSKFIKFMSSEGIVLVGTSISNDEYYVCAKRQVICKAAEKLSVIKFNYKTKREEVFLVEYINEFDPRYENNYFIQADLNVIFTQSELLFLMNYHLRSIRINNKIRRILPCSRINEYIISYFLRKEVITEIYSLHDYATINEIWEKNCSNFFYPQGQDIFYYFGEEMALYFEWTYFYLKWLSFPSVVGFCIYFLVPTAGTNKRFLRNPYLPLYGITMIFWGFFLTKFWIRHQSHLAGYWNIVGRPLNQLMIRSEFKGNMKYNYISRKFELYYPRSSRRIRFAFSAFVLTIFLLIGFLLTTCSLNLRGYVTKNTFLGKNNLFFIQFLNQYSQRHAIFDSKGTFRFVPIMMHTTMLFVMNSIIFKSIAIKLTNLENHRTDSDYFFYLVLKRFIFDSLDTYFALLYLAFIEQDMPKLLSTLHSLFLADMVRHIVLKYVLPWTTLNFKFTTDRLLAKERLRRTSLATFWNSRVTIDSYMGVYDTFDDYLKIVIEYGYIMLFASVSPLPAQITFVFNLLVLKMDCAKLLFLFKRPLSYRTDSTLPWIFIMTLLTWVSIVTNVFIFGMTSGQLAYWIPSWFKLVTFRQKHTSEDDGQIIRQSILPDKAVVAICSIVLVEHVIIIIGVLIHFGVRSTGKETRDIKRFREQIMNSFYIKSLGYVNHDEV